MDQKNTIVKCYANPNCLFNHNGVCDNYVISIGADGSCQEYIETATEEDLKDGAIGEYKTINVTCGDCEYFENIDNCPVYKRTQVLFGMDPICPDFQFKGQRAKGNLFDNMMDIDDKHLGEPVTVQMKIAEFNKLNKNKSIIKKNLFDEQYDEEYEALFKPNKHKGAIKDAIPECDLPICDWSCKHALRSGPSFNPDLWCDKMKGKPAVGLFCADYEED